MFHALHGSRTSLLIEARPGKAPVWRYWGARLPDDSVPEAALSATRPLPSFSLDDDVPLTTFPLNGDGWFNQTALLAHRGGQGWSQAVTASDISAGPQRLTIVLRDDVAKITVTQTLSLGLLTDVVTVSAHLTNDGDAPLDVQWFAAATLPLPAEAQTVRYFSGRHQGEFNEQSQALSRSLWRRENRRGLTSHDCPPTGFVETANGGLYGAHLAWSGNSVQQIEWLDHGHFLWQFGEWLAPGEVILAPGDTLSSPEVIATFSPDGRNGVMQNFHRDIRKRIGWPGGKMKPRPVQINTWEGFYFKHDLAGMKALADEAARLGIERFILDDGWFHARDDDRTSLGDWWPDEKKYPEGLKPLADHVVSKGMEFGLWFEPEMVNPDSDLARAHPDWILSDAGRPDMTARNQLVLDLTQPGVTDYLFSAMSKLLSQLPIAYIKWDHNRDLVARGDRPMFRKQVLATYALMTRLREAFPHLEIEACAGGGGRIDAGILANTHRFWTSDNLDAVSRLPMQRGFLSVFPPEVMGAHIGTAPAHGTRRTQSLDFRAAVALPGHFGVELDVLKLSDRDKAKLQEWIALHKALRPRLHSGNVWRGEAGDGVVWQAHGDDDALLLFVYRVEPTLQRHAPAVRLPMLECGAQYRVQRIDRTRTNQTAPFQDALLSPDGVVIEGAWLAQSGLPLPQLMAETCAIYDLSRIELLAPV